MKKHLLLLIPALAAFARVQAQSATIKLTATNLMHEMRTTPSPLDREVLRRNPQALMWPLPAEFAPKGAALDGMEAHSSHVSRRATYKVRLSRDAGFKTELTETTLPWPFFNVGKPLATGTWYWQYGYVKDGVTEWSKVLRFTVPATATTFSPPSYADVAAKVPASHPRILVDRDGWDAFIERSKTMPERQWYLDAAEKVLKKQMQTMADVDTSKLAGLTNAVERGALLTRESRRIVDREESNVDVLIRAWLLTRDRRYADEGIKRILTMVSWSGDKTFSGDFNQSTLLSICSMGYDAFWDVLTEDQKKTMRESLRENGGLFFSRFVNHFENHIADNHTVQMTLRYFSLAAFAMLGELPEAKAWTDYAYNIWIARFPGVNSDGAWHNGDSYFHVNLRTLVELPWFYQRLTGFDYFSDPWYQGNAMYVIYNQPPFSKSAGTGSSHQNVLTPNGTRLAYADALARLTGNTYLADYRAHILAGAPGLMKTGFGGKAGDLSWFRLQCDLPLPATSPGLKDLLRACVFPETGLAMFDSDLDDYSRNAMVSFRSSPYGSTSHQVANQNAFNTFYGGKSLFYSSGHHISFVDPHVMYAARASRAHNTILVNGMGQRIGVEGYGWIPRHYEGTQISYVLGDASNAYGPVVSPLWLERGRASGIEYSPANGWDKNRLKTFRRHMVELGDASLLFIYDELEADTAVTWDYLLHTVAEPMQFDQASPWLHVRATNGPGASDAYILSAQTAKVETTDQFFYPAINWLRADDKGHFAPYPNHWHLSATYPAVPVCRLVTIISTRPAATPAQIPVITPGGLITIGDWIIKANTTPDGPPTFNIQNKSKTATITYKTTTTITEKGKTTTLSDTLPTLEI